MGHLLPGCLYFPRRLGSQPSVMDLPAKWPFCEAHSFERPESLFVHPKNSCSAMRLLVRVWGTPLVIRPRSAIVTRARLQRAYSSAKALSDSVWETGA